MLCSVTISQTTNMPRVRPHKQLRYLRSPPRNNLQRICSAHQSRNAVLQTLPLMFVWQLYSTRMDGSKEWTSTYHKGITKGCIIYHRDNRHGSLHADAHRYLQFPITAQRQHTTRPLNVAPTRFCAPLHSVARRSPIYLNKGFFYSPRIELYWWGHRGCIVLLVAMPVIS